MKKMIVICLCSLMVVLSEMSSAGSLKVKKAEVYKLGVSVNTPMQTFNDVPPSHPFYSDIEATVAAGVMEGETSLTFNPWGGLLRGYAAQIIERAAFGQFSSPALPNPTHFTDVTSHVYRNWIEDFAERGITNGCGFQAYCPDVTIPRDQMAVFLVRAIDGVNNPPPTPSTQRFADVSPSHPFYAYIDRLAALNITNGCGFNSSNQLIFCPTDGVSRGQAAALLKRAFNL